MNKYLKLAKLRVAQAWYEMTQHKKATMGGGVIGVVAGWLLPSIGSIILIAVATLLLVYWIRADGKS